MILLGSQVILISAILAATAPLAVGELRTGPQILANGKQCANKPAGRLQENLFGVCPLPGLLGIIPGIEAAIVSPWTTDPKCVTKNQEISNTTTRVHCIFADGNFRNGHGLSLITTTTTASHLVGLDAFADRPDPLEARKRDASGPAYEIVDIEGRGKGALASRSIRRGEIIMVDVPAVLVGTEFLSDVKAHHRRRLIKQAINLLPNETRDAVWSLSRNTGEYEIDSIMGANANTVALSDDGIHVGLFPKASVSLELNMSHGYRHDSH